MNIVIIGQDVCCNSKNPQLRHDVLLILQRCLTIVKLIMSVTAMIITAARAASGM